ncbi:MAG: Tar ligand binding domain-containing protein [Polaromonas sp.]
MNNLKISTRLMILIGILSILLIAIGSVGLFGISQSNDALRSVYQDRTVPMGQLAGIQENLLRNRLVIANSLANPTSEEITKNTAEVDANIANINKVWTAYMATTLTIEEAKIAKKFEEGRVKFVQEGLRPAVVALRANDMDGAKRLIVEKIRPLWAPVRDGMAVLRQLQIDQAKKEYEAAVARYATIRMVSIAATWPARCLPSSSA